MVKNAKKFLIFVFTLLLSFCSLPLFLSCGKDDNNDKISIVCTIFPEYDWICEVIKDKKDNFELTLLMTNGTDLHNYSPTVADIIKISTADVFVYVGGESDNWVDNALKNTVNENMIVINLLDLLGDRAKEEEIKEGMEENEETDDEEEIEYDEHVWLSLKNVKIFIKEFAEKFGDVDNTNKDYYIANANSYIEKLNELDLNYKQVIDNGNKKTLVFGDRFPFRYLVDDYDLDYFAAFVGCSAESEASFETITFLAEKVNELGIGVILKIETSNGSIANTIKENTTTQNQTILTLDSMQNTTIKSGKTYLSIMQSNLEIIKEAVR